MSDDVKPKKKIEKPLNPLAAKPGQKYDKPSFTPTKEYDGGKLNSELDKTKGAVDVVDNAAKEK